MNIEIHERNRFNELLHKIHNNIEDTAFKLHSRRYDTKLPYELD